MLLWASPALSIRLRPQMLCETRFCTAINFCLKWLTVIIVLGLIASIITLGVAFIIPHLKLQPLHYALAAWFSASIFFNYYLTVRQSPGSPQVC